jgi:hypothetical protein
MEELEEDVGMVNLDENVVAESKNFGNNRSARLVSIDIRWSTPL